MAGLDRQIHHYDPMVSPEWLGAHLEDDNVVAIDATWCMPGDEEPLKGQSISGVRFDIDEIADREAVFAHTLPSPEQFENQVRELGINADDHVICYDRHGIFSAPRAWWMFRAMGHENVQVLDGGLPVWKALNYPVVDKSPKLNRGNFKAMFNEELVLGISDVRAASTDNRQILDARPCGRFDGTAPEPRAGLSSGHMPGATNVPFSSLFDNGILKSKSELAEIFERASVDLDAPIITSCGSGITACGIAMALARVGGWHAAVYDGSWVEWASTDNCPIAKAE